VPSKDKLTKSASDANMVELRKRVGEALDKLAQVDPAAAELVKLRYFIGMTMDESALALGLSKRSAEGLWTYARVWLRQEIRGNRLA